MENHWALFNYFFFLLYCSKKSGLRQTARLLIIKRTLWIFCFNFFLSGGFSINKLLRPDSYCSADRNEQVEKIAREIRPNESTPKNSVGNGRRNDYPNKMRQFPQNIFKIKMKIV